MIDITIAHSPDPDDVFMWWPLTGMVDPRDPTSVLSPPEIDTRPFRFASLPADIAVLNRRAVDRGDLDVTALSMFTYAHVAERYVLTACGSSMGEGYGPKLVVNRGVHAGAASRIADDPAAMLREVLASRSSARVAVPGLRTTAFACLCMLMGWRSSEEWASRVVEMPFDQILPAVADGRPAPDGGDVAAGLLIHQSQLTYAHAGVLEAVDFGRWWLDGTGLPLPLGGNAIRRDLDARHGAGTSRRLVELLDRSVRYALEHRQRSVRYAHRYAPELTAEQIERYIDMYVTPLTVDMGESGERAVFRLLTEASSRGLCRALATGVQHVVRP